MRRALPLILILLILASVLWVLLSPSRSTPAAATPPPPPPPSLSALASPPDWSKLETIPAKFGTHTLRRQLESIYALPDSWQNVLKFDQNSLQILKENPFPTYQSIQTPSTDIGDPACDLTTTPLSDLHIAIDPGHIGGDYAHIEQRNFDPTPDDPSDIPVREGDLTLATARYLKPLLEKLGCRVSLVRDSPHPVTDATPDDFLADYPDRTLAEKIFYRTAEIRARAHLVNDVIKPDLVLALHYNADAWNGENPWSARNHFHIILHGAYMKEELALDDQRFEMVRHLLTRTTELALPLAKTISRHFLENTDLVPYEYSPAAPAIRLDEDQPIFARNLLANRLYESPTIYMEPYVMNHPEVFQRVQLGDYDGTRSINGVEKMSLIREYAHLLADAIALHYKKQK